MYPVELDSMLRHSGEREKAMLACLRSDLWNIGMLVSGNEKHFSPEDFLEGGRRDDSLIGFAEDVLNRNLSQPEPEQVKSFINSLTSQFKFKTGQVQLAKG